MWTTLDGYVLRLPPMNPGELRALMHQADLQEQLAAHYRGDLSQAARAVLARLAQNAHRVGTQRRGYPVFASQLDGKRYQIVTRPLAAEGSLIVSILRD